MTLINSQSSCLFSSDRPLAYVEVTGQRYSDEKFMMPLFCDTGAQDDIVSLRTANEHGIHINRTIRNDSLIDVQGNPIECVGTGTFYMHFRGLVRPSKSGS